MNSIYLYERELIVCPSCGGTKWLVTQHLSRTTDVLRVDGLGDLSVEPFDENAYDESLVLTCCGCSIKYQPQSGVACVEEGRADAINVYDSSLDEEIVWPSRAKNTKEL
jgi:hypothetical protein